VIARAPRFVGTTPRFDFVLRLFADVANLMRVFAVGLVFDWLQCRRIGGRPQWTPGRRSAMRRRCGGRQGLGTARGPSAAFLLDLRLRVALLLLLLLAPLMVLGARAAARCGSVTWLREPLPDTRGARQTGMRRPSRNTARARRRRMRGGRRRSGEEEAAAAACATAAQADEAARGRPARVVEGPGYPARPPPRRGRLAPSCCTRRRRWSRCDGEGGGFSSSSRG
jgi:hypothetical protein